MQGQNEIEGHKSLFIVVFAFFCIEYQAAWLSASQDPLGHSFLEISTYRDPPYLLRLLHILGKHPGMSTFQQNDMPFKRYLGPL